MPLETIKFSELTNAQLLELVTPSADFDSTTDQFYPAPDALNEVVNRSFPDTIAFAAYVLESEENANGYGRFSTIEEMVSARTQSASHYEGSVYGGYLKRANTPNL